MVKTEESLCLICIFKALCTETQEDTEVLACDFFKETE